MLGFSTNVTYSEPTIVKPYNKVEVNDALYDEMQKFAELTKQRWWLRFLAKNPKTTKFRVGDKVYVPSCPQSPGIVVATFIAEVWRYGDKKDDPKFSGRKPMWQEDIAHVRWLPVKSKKVIETLTCLDRLNSFTALIEDHRSKLKKHESKIELLEALI
jgi:hypothetical protein